MLKVFFVFIVGLLVIGCGAGKSMAKPSGMFQSVSEKEAVLVQDSKDKKHCVRCGMNLVKFYKTSHSMKHDGKNQQYCSIHCLQEHVNSGAKIDTPKVVDVTSLKFIDVNRAYYVVGSKKRGTMSRISKYAFSNESDAKEFQSNFDGEIMNFEGALEKAKIDFK